MAWDNIETIDIVMELILETMWRPITVHNGQRFREYPTVYHSTTVITSAISGNRTVDNIDLLHVRLLGMVRKRKLPVHYHLDLARAVAEISLRRLTLSQFRGRSVVL